MRSYNDRHQAFIEEIRSGIKEFEANVSACGDMSVDTENDDLMAELEKRFDELFGTASD